MSVVHTEYERFRQLIVECRGGQREMVNAAHMSYHMLHEKIDSLGLRTFLNEVRVLNARRAEAPRIVAQTTNTDWAIYHEQGLE